MLAQDVGLFNHEATNDALAFVTHHRFEGYPISVIAERIAP